MKNILIVLFLAFLSNGLLAQTLKLEKKNLLPNQVYMSIKKLDGQEVLSIVKDSTLKAIDEPTFVKIKGVDFQDGTIEVKVLSRLLKTARPSDRGFIGVAYRINEDNSKFECIYIRPTNGRADDQVRRNHSVQYFSYPDFKFDRLRKEAPEKYETYADMGLNEWITMRIEIKGNKVQLFLNNQKYPTFIVNDMKSDNASGGIGLWVDVGTDGYFRDLKITK